MINRGVEPTEKTTEKKSIDVKYTKYLSYIL
jgi:hypothetical protein